MKCFVSIIFFVLLFSFSACAQGLGKITGTVRLGSEDTVLHEVSVQIVELKKKVVTDKVGSYVFADLPPGHYTLVAHQEGFADQTEAVDVTAGGAATADFRMQLSGLKEQVTVTATGSEMAVGESIS